jgi:lambda family phage minor tail protein L
MTTIIQEANKLNPDIYLELFDFDATSLGGVKLYFTNTPTGGINSAITWRTNHYYPFEFELTGIEARADGNNTSRPQIKVNNINKFFWAALSIAGDLEGMIITRWRTFYKFTDNGDEPNINMHYPLNVWVVTRSLPSSNKTGLQYELSGPLDIPNLMLPKEQILRDTGFPGVNRVRAR